MNLFERILALDVVYLRCPLIVGQELQAYWSSDNPYAHIDLESGRDYYTMYEGAWRFTLATLDITIPAYERGPLGASKFLTFLDS